MPDQEIFSEASMTVFSMLCVNGSLDIIPILTDNGGLAHTGISDSNANNAKNVHNVRVMLITIKFQIVHVRSHRNMIKHLGKNIKIRSTNSQQKTCFPVFRFCLTFRSLLASKSDSSLQKSGREIRVDKMTSQILNDVY